MNLASLQAIPSHFCQLSFQAAITPACPRYDPALDEPKYRKVDINPVFECWHRLHADYVASLSGVYAASILMVE
jgi:hypothetical protein